MPAAILVVEDDAIQAQFVCSLLAQWGWKADWAPNLEKARRLLTGQAYSVVITDLNLGTAGNRDGMEVIRLSAELLPTVGIVLMSGGLTAQDERNALTRGARVVLSKPSSAAALRRAVEGLLRP